MTAEKRAALVALEQAVVAGKFGPPEFDLCSVAMPSASYPEYYAMQVMKNGSLDAAKALHEALLPEWRMDALWQGGVLCGNEDDWSCRLRCVSGKSRVVENDERAALPNPARAWLLAIIRAIIAQEGGE